MIKKLSFWMLMVGISTTSFAQNAIVDHFSDYEANEKFTRLHATSKAFEMALELESDNPEEQELIEALGKIKGMTVLMTDNTEEAAAMFKQATSRPDKDYEVLMTVDDNDGHAVFYVREDRGTIAELLVIAHGAKEFGIATIWGEIDLKQVKKLTDTFTVQGMEKFDEAKAAATRDIKVYPNPSTPGSPAQIDIPESLQGGTIEIRDLNGKRVAQAKARMGKQALPVANLSPGTYLVVLQFEGLSLYSERLVVE
ncbi:MAG: DUF4252 domain-containing protein [Flavobacteriales bacterium]|nr:DUF4252 domain-containing protein [Flavobacteriales bacterium]